MAFCRFATQEMGTEHHCQRGRPERDARLLRCSRSDDLLQGEEVCVDLSTFLLFLQCLLWSCDGRM